MRTTILLLISLFIGACSSTSQVRKKQDFIHEQVLRYEAEKLEREPASVSWQLKDLNKIKPERFEVYVLPKISNRNHKSNLENEEFLGKAQTFEVSTLALDKCDSFFKPNFFKKYQPTLYFSKSLERSDLDCAIIEITSREIKNAKRHLLVKNDVLSVRLYVDSRYRTHGYEQDSYNAEKRIETLRVKTDANQVMSSGLSLFPVDIPNMMVMQISNLKTSSEIQTDLSRILDPIAIFSIRKQNNKFELAGCGARVVSYKNYFGERVEASWCDVDPWPFFIETDRYIAIRQNFTIRE